MMYNKSILLFFFLLVFSSFARAEVDFAFVGFSPNLDWAAWEEIKYSKENQQGVDSIYFVNLKTGESGEKISSMQRINLRGGDLKTSAKELRTLNLKKSLPRLRNLKINIASGFKTIELDSQTDFWYEKSKGKEIKYVLRDELPALNRTQKDRLCRQYNLSLDTRYGSSGAYNLAFEDFVTKINFLEEECFWNFEFKKVYTVFNGVKKMAVVFVHASGVSDKIFPIFFEYKGNR